MCVYIYKRCRQLCTTILTNNNSSSNKKIMPGHSWNAGMHYNNNCFFLYNIPAGMYLT